MPNITNALRARGIGVGKKRTGDALPANVLAGKVFSNKDGADILGTMANRPNGQAPASYTAWDNGATRQLAVRIPMGAYVSEFPAGSGNTEIQIAQNTLRPENIKSGQNIFGVQGTFTNDAVLDPYWLTEGSSGYDDGVLKWGTSPRRGQYTDAVSFSDPGGIVYVRIPEGTYRDKSSLGYPEIRVNDAWLRWTGDVESDDNNVLSGNRYWAYGAKRTGTMPNRGFPDVYPNGADQWFPWGYYDSGGRNQGFVVRAVQRFSERRGVVVTDSQGFAYASWSGFQPTAVFIVEGAPYMNLSVWWWSIFSPNNFSYANTVKNVGDYGGLYFNTTGMKVYTGRYNQQVDWVAYGYLT